MGLATSLLHQIEGGKHLDVRSADVEMFASVMFKGTPVTFTFRPFDTDPRNVMKAEMVIDGTRVVKPFEISEGTGGKPRIYWDGYLPPAELMHAVDVSAMLVINLLKACMPQPEVDPN